MRSNAGRGASASGGTRVNGRPNRSSTVVMNLSTPMPSRTYLRRALSRLVRSPVSMNTRTMASATLVASSGRTMMPVSLAKSLCPVMPPTPRRNHTPGSTPKPSFTSTAVKAMSLVSSSTAILPAPSIGDVEFARQTGQRTVVEDVIMPFTRVRPGVDQFLRIDTGGRRARDVADVVGAGAARTESEILNALDQRHRMLRRNFAKLQIGARGDVAERPAQLFGQIRQPSELPVLEDAVGDAQPAHVGSCAGAT